MLHYSIWFRDIPDNEYVNMFKRKQIEKHIWQRVSY